MTDPHLPDSTEPPRIRYDDRRDPLPWVSILIVVLALAGAFVFLAAAVAQILIAAVQDAQGGALPHE